MKHRYQVPVCNCSRAYRKPFRHSWQCFHVTLWNIGAYDALDR